MHFLFNNVSGLANKHKAVHVIYFNLSKFSVTDLPDIYNIGKTRLDTMAINQIPDSVELLSVLLLLFLFNNNDSLISWEDISGG